MMMSSYSGPLIHYLLLIRIKYYQKMDKKEIVLNRIMIATKK